MTERNRRLHALFEADWKQALKDHPELATYFGVPGNDGRWTDHSLAAIAGRKRRKHRSLKALTAIPRDGLSAADRLDHELYERELREEIAGQAFPDELLPIDQLRGAQQDLARVLEMMRPRRLDGYPAVLGRLESIPGVIDQTIALMEEGMTRGVIPPRITLQDVPRQLRAQLEADPDQSGMVAAFRTFPETVPPAEQARLRREARALLTGTVRPALRRLHDFVAERYLPAGRASVGLSELPDGEAWYAHKVRFFTSLDTTPGELHELGLREVARIRQELERRVRATGFRGGWEAFGELLRTDPRFYFTDAESLLSAYRDIAKRIDPGLVRLFGRLPRLPYGIEPVPAHAAPSAPTAYFQPGSLEGGRPGWYLANTYKLKARPRWEMEALTLHEAVPGHHLQLALAAEMEEVPEFRKHSMHIAFVEGWALYAEALGEELGLYEDPYSKIGQLSFEIWRAARLVVDTGLHAFGWSRKRAIDYLMANSFKTRHDARCEIDRYVAMPGQALAYKVGELKISGLRARALQALGGRFDLRAFHDALLANGALPLDVLDRLMTAWIAAEAAAGKVRKRRARSSG